jgi:hypothetical protein
MTEWVCKQCNISCHLKVPGKHDWQPDLCVFDVRDENDKLKSANWWKVV